MVVGGGLTWGLDRCTAVWYNEIGGGDMCVCLFGGGVGCVCVKEKKKRLCEWMLGGVCLGGRCLRCVESRRRFWRGIREGGSFWNEKEKMRKSKEGGMKILEERKRRERGRRLV